MSAANRELFFLQPLSFVSFHQGKENKPAAGKRVKYFKTT
jgi:hypothetical protein